MERAREDAFVPRRRLTAKTTRMERERLPRELLGLSSPRLFACQKLPNAADEPRAADVRFAKRVLVLTASAPSACWAITVAATTMALCCLPRKLRHLPQLPQERPARFLNH